MGRARASPCSRSSGRHRLTLAALTPNLSPTWRYGSNPAPPQPERECEGPSKAVSACPPASLPADRSGMTFERWLAALALTGSRSLIRACVVRARCGLFIVQFQAFIAAPLQGASPSRELTWRAGPDRRSRQRTYRRHRCSCASPPVNDHRRAVKLARPPGRANAGANARPGHRRHAEFARNAKHAVGRVACDPDERVLHRPAVAFDEQALHLRVQLGHPIERRGVVPNAARPTRIGA